MGGGDLNLKKSWHPSTFSNLERVWKAEQKHDAEEKKIAQLQQELKEERAREEMQRTAVEAGAVKKKDSRVEWLYSGPASTVNREEYLLGKKIDKLVDPTLAEAEREKEALASGPGALFVEDSAGGAASAADLAIKVREDPLFLIKQKEEEAKKKLASNPIKLKQLQQLLESEGKREKSEHKKKRKHKRHRDHSESPPPSRKHRRGRSSSPESKGHHHSHGRSSRDTDGDRVLPPSSRPVPLPSSSSHSRPSRAPRHQHRPPPRSRTRGMDPEELERRRQEMMDNAKEHDQDRVKRLRKHEKEEKDSEESVKTKKKSNFLQPLRVQSLSSSASLGDRIHRNIHAVQRTAAQLDANFLEK